TAELLLARSSARKDMARIGIEIRSLDDTADESIWSELYGLAAETIPDIPSTFSEAIPSFEDWLARMHEPGVFVDRIWTAWRDDSLVAYTYLVYPAAGDVSTAYTGTRKQFRGLGIARAVKLESIGPSDRTREALDHHQQRPGERRDPAHQFDTRLPAIAWPGHVRKESYELSDARPDCPSFRECRTPKLGGLAGRSRARLC